MLRRAGIAVMPPVLAAAARAPPICAKRRRVIRPITCTPNDLGAPAFGAAAPSRRSLEATGLQHKGLGRPGLWGAAAAGRRKLKASRKPSEAMGMPLPAAPFFLYIAGKSPIGSAWACVLGRAGSGVGPSAHFLFLSRGFWQERTPR